MRTIVITNQKGGCGKTTTAVNLAAALAQTGQRVLMVDLDPQAHATLGLGCEPDSCKRTIYHSLANKQVAISRIILNTQIPGLDLAPSSIQLARAEQELANVSRKEYILANQLETVSKKYDICIIDCPPSLGLLTFSALVASTDVIIPVQVHYYALEGLKQLLETVKTARKRFYPCSVKILGILLTFVEKKAALSHQVEQQMRGFFGELVFDTVIHRTISLAEAPSAGQSISTYAPESKGSAEYKALAEEITDTDYKKQKKQPAPATVAVDEEEDEEEYDEQVEVEEPDIEEKKPAKKAKAPARKVKAAAKKVKAAAPAPIPVPEIKTPVAREEAARRIPLIVRETPKDVLRPASRFRAAVKKFIFLLILAIPVAAAVVFVVYAMNLSNTPPLAEHSSVTVPEDSPTQITLQASDADGDRLSYRVVKGPSHGSLSGTGPVVTYTPESDYNGPDKILFAVNDEEVDSDTATISIKVVAADDPPKADPQSLSTKVDKSVSITLAGRDIDSKTFSYIVATQPKNGILSIGSNFADSGKLVYAPKPGFIGSDSFTFKLNDGTSEGEPATVKIDVTGNHIPMAEPQTISALEDSPTVVNLKGSDPDGDTVVYSVVQGPSHGALSGTAPNLTYMPNKNFSGPDSFTFKVNDATADSTLSTVSINVTQVNDPPEASKVNVTLSEDTKTSIILRGIDPDGSQLTYSIVTHPSHGTLSGTEPNMVYTPEENYNGPDSFTFKVNDGTADSTHATVSIMVTDTDDAPVAYEDNITVEEDQEQAIVLSGSDPDGDPLAYSVLRNPAHGKLSGTAPNLVYTPDPNFSWLDSFTFRVNDGNADSAPATVKISVTPVNDPPVANDDELLTQEDTPATIDVLANDTEVDNELLKITSISKGKGGSAKVNATGSLTYTPNPDFHGRDEFTYTVTDREGTSDTARVRVTVTSANDAPRITSKPVINAMVGVKYKYAVIAEDPDAGDILTYRLTSRPAGMTVDSGTGVILWTPTGGDKDQTFEVAVEVTDSNSTPVSDVQQFEVKVNPTPPRRAVLTVADGYDHTARKRLSQNGKLEAVKASDDKRIEAGYGSTISYDFTNVTIPSGAKVASVTLYIRHYEEESFPFGKLRWELGKGWPENPAVWFRLDSAPVRKGKLKEATDALDITSFADTAEKIESFQLLIKNVDNVTRKKAFVNYIYLDVEWDWPIEKEPARRQKKDLDEPDDGLELFRR